MNRIYFVNDAPSPDCSEKPGVKNGIVVYSNCDEVALYDDLKQPIARMKNPGIGIPFVFNNILLSTNVLVAIGLQNGKFSGASDEVVINAFPQNKKISNTHKNNKQNITLPQKEHTYLYRINCGGDACLDSNKNLWNADNSNINSSFYSTSWTNQFDIKPKAFTFRLSTCSSRSL